MEIIGEDTDIFYSPPVSFITSANKKILSIPSRKEEDSLTPISRSWDESRFLNRKPNSHEKMPITLNIPDNLVAESMLDIEHNFHNPINHPRRNCTSQPWKLNLDWRHSSDLSRGSYRPYDAINNCKSAGVIPYCIINGSVFFLLQNFLHPVRKKDSGWNDFGGKRIDMRESTAETAAREFSEETSCLFYLNDKTFDTKSRELYELFKDNPDLAYDSDTISKLKQTIGESQTYYTDKITEFVSPIHISSKETYISYFVRVSYIPASDLPRAEDIHIEYDLRYIRECKWFSYAELMALDDKNFHKRLQITRIQQRIASYHEKGLFC